MKVNFLLRQTSMDDKTRAIIEKKLAKLDKFFREEAQASVTVTKVREKEKLELTISQRGKLFRSEVTAESASFAIDTAVDV
ncbi:MAG: HPF/RaiA family ribosome-associated protein, partial [Clostridiales bacterium]|nr:HPF/RaiA family ribosome-associated protein [Clostridiales bacterium]